MADGDIAPKANRFDALDPDSKPNRFDQFDEEPGEKYLTPQASTMGAFRRSAQRGAVPAAGGLVGAGAGVEAGGLAGAGVGTLIAGPAGTAVGGAIGGFVGGALGMFGGAYLTEEAQDWALKQLPDSWTEAIGMSDRQRRLDESQHPTASFLGGLTPYALTMRPGLSFKAAKLPENATSMQRVMANPVTQRAFGGAVMGGFELGTEAAQGNVDWANVAYATGFGVVFNKPTRLGERLTGLGAAPVRGVADTGRAVGQVLYGRSLSFGYPDYRTGIYETELNQRGPGLRYYGDESAADRFGRTYVDENGEVRFADDRPITVAEAAARGVMGPGITEEVYRGTHLQDPTAQMLADEQHRQELAVLYGPYEQDIHSVVRHDEPELFERYDALERQRLILQQWQQETHPPSIRAQLDNLNAQATRIQAEREKPNWGPERRRLDAMADDIERQREAVLQGHAASLIGETSARGRQLGEDLRSVEAEMDRLSLEVKAAYRRAEEHLGRRPVIEPNEVEPRVQPVAPPAAGGGGAAGETFGTGTKSLGDQKAFIANDVARQLITAGRPYEEAMAAGKLMAERYAARAARFQGKLGTAEELYRREGAIIQGPEGGPRQPPPEAPAAPAAPAAAETPAPAAAAEPAPAAPAAPAPAIPEKYQGWKVGDAVEVGPVKGLMVREVLPDGFILEGQRNSRYKFTPPEKGPKASPTGLEMLEYMERLPDAEPEGPKPFADALSEEVERIWAENPQWSRTSMKGINPRTGKLRRGNRQAVARQERNVQEIARFNVMMQEAKDIIAGYVKDNTLTEEQVAFISKYYNRGADETPEQAFNRAFDKFDIRDEREALQTPSEIIGSIEDTMFQTRDSDVISLRDQVEKRWEDALKKGDRFSRNLRNLPIPTELVDLGKHDPAGAVADFERVISDVTMSDSSRVVGQQILDEMRAAHDRVRSFRDLVERAAQHVDEYKQSELFPTNNDPGRAPANDLFQGRRLGSYNPVTRIMRLGRDADASTFIHEAGHDFLEQLRRDAAHPEAPGEVRDDWDTVLQWLKVKSGEDIKRGHHEKFAQGFEQYLREGVAPSRALGDVFARFKDWLLNIYQTLKGLGKPINDDIRGVFDRMLAEEPQRTVVAPERERQPSLADVQERDAVETEPFEAPAVADRMAAEQDIAAQEPPPEVQREIQPIIAEVRAATAAPERGGEAANGAEAGGAVEGGGGAAGTEPGGGNVAEGNAAGGAGGGAATAKGPGVSGGGGSERGAGPASEPPLSPRPAQRYGAKESPYLDKAGNLRPELITNDDTLWQAMRDMADANDGFIGDRRGIVSDIEVQRQAEAIGLEGALSMAEARKIGQAHNAGELWAFGAAWETLARDQEAKMQIAGLPGATEADVLAFTEATARTQLMQAALSGGAAEGGRTLRIFQVMKNRGGSAAEIAQASMGKTLFQMRELAKLGSEMKTSREIGKFINDMQKKSFGRMVIEYWINGLISGVSTHTTYTVGNTIFATNKAIFETAAAAAIGRVRESMGREGERVHLGEVGAQISAAARGYVPSVHSSLESLRTGVTSALPGEEGRGVLPFYTGRNLVTPAALKEDATMRDVAASWFGIGRGVRDAFLVSDDVLKAIDKGDANLFGTEYSPTGTIPNVRVGALAIPTGEVARMPSRFVGAIHTFFRSMNYSMDIASQAYRKAATEGLEGMAFDARVAALRQNPTVEMMERARHTANDLTLMGAGSKFTQKMSAFFNHEFFEGSALQAPWLKLVDPFVHISSNIISEALIKRSPLGAAAYFAPKSELGRDLRGLNGNVAQDKALARMLVGTAFMTLVGGLAAQGLVSGSGPTDPREAAMWRLAGNQAHSVRIGDFWYDTHRLGVQGMLFSMAADLYDVAHLANEGQFTEAGGHLFHAITQNVLDESFMRGPSELVRAVEDHNGYGAVYLRNLGASFLPYSVLMSQTARAIDPYSREARTAIDALRQKIPSASMDLLPKYDVWGQEVPSREVLLGASGLLAIYAQHVGTDPVNQAMLQLGKYPAPVERKIRGVELTDEQHAEFAKLAGRMAKSRLDVIVNSPDWKQMPPEARSAVVDAQIRQSREVAAGYIMSRDPTIPGRAVLQKRENFDKRIQHGSQYNP